MRTITHMISATADTVIDTTYQIGPPLPLNLRWMSLMSCNDPEARIRTVNTGYEMAARPRQSFCICHHTTWDITSYASVNVTQRTRVILDANPRIISPKFRTFFSCLSVVFLACDRSTPSSICRSSKPQWQARRCGVQVRRRKDDGL